MQLKYESKYNEKIKEYVKKYAQEEHVNPKCKTAVKTNGSVSNGQVKQEQDNHKGDHLSETSLNHGEDDEDDLDFDGDCEDLDALDDDDEENNNQEKAGDLNSNKSNGTLEQVDKLSKHSKHSEINGNGEPLNNVQEEQKQSQ